MKFWFLLVCFGLWAGGGMAGKSDMEDKLRAAVAAGDMKGLHSVLVIHKGEIFAEVYFPGEDQRWGTPLGMREHGPDTLHDLRSVTKSIVGLLYGIALGEGIVPEVNDALLESFPEYADLAADPARQKVDVGHVLTMKMGFEWDESLPYSDPRNSEIAMELAEDRYRFALDRPIVGPPGEQWQYNGGATAIIARLIEKGSGMPLDQFAADRLFQPLGITDFDWVQGGDGQASAASGLRLNIHDLAKIGQMVLDDGAHEGTQIVPSDWLKASFTPQAELDWLRYGYFWWLAGGKGAPFWVAGFGNGGQRMTIQANQDLLILVNAGNYNQPDDWKIPVRVIDEFLVPAFRKHLAEK